MRQTLVTMIIISIFLCLSAAGKSKSKKRILAKDHPKIAMRVIFFEDRINSLDYTIRLRALYELSTNNFIPDKDYIHFLKALYDDPNEIIRGNAIKILYDMWIPQKKEDLPDSFIGYHNGHFVTKNNPQKLLNDLKLNGTGAGYAAYVLGLLQEKKAIPDLKLLSNHKNIFVRCEAAKALLQCGDRASAVAIFHKESLDQLAIYENEKQNVVVKLGLDDRKQPWYAANSCRGLIEAGGKEKKIGYQRLIKLMEYLENSENVNDKNSLHSIRNIISIKANKFINNSKEATDWLKVQK